MEDKVARSDKQLQDARGEWIVEELVDQDQVLVPMQEGAGPCAGFLVGFLLTYNSPGLNLVVVGESKKLGRKEMFEAVGDDI